MSWSLHDLEWSFHDVESEDFKLFSAHLIMQNTVADLLEKEKTVILSDLPIPGMSEGVTQVIMEGVCLDHEQ